MGELRKNSESLATGRVGLQFAATFQKLLDGAVCQVTLAPMLD